MILTIGRDSGATGKLVPAVQFAFKLVAVKNIAFTPGDGDRHVRCTAACRSGRYTQAPTGAVVPSGFGGWNRVTNANDNTPIPGLTMGVRRP